MNGDLQHSAGQDSVHLFSLHNRMVNTKQGNKKRTWCPECGGPNTLYCVLAQMQHVCVRADDVAVCVSLDSDIAVQLGSQKPKPKSFT